ncbi:MAG: hypothetical protein GY694_15905, partial [Gammaproteobacteria bacterium]|nr:hypothetical protein [Gammaproteobacteria bacterium]
MKLFRFACALVNDTNANLFCDSAQADHDIDMLLRSIDLQNDIRESLETTGWQKCSLDSKIHSLVPEYDLDDLLDWCGGSYAMKLAQSYIYHGFDLKFQHTQKMPHVIRVQGLVSRFSVKCNLYPKRHTVYVRFDPLISKKRCLIVIVKVEREQQADV